MPIEPATATDRPADQRPRSRISRSISSHSDVRARRSRREAAEPLLRLGGWDWLFVFFSWLTAGWLVVITLDARAGGSLGFDFMPVMGGIPIVVLGWRAVRIGDDVAEVVARLDDNAGLVLSEGDSIADLQAALRRRMLKFAVVSAGSIALFMASSFAALLITGRLTVAETPDEQAQTIALGVVLIGVGAVLGFLLGRLVGYGGLFRLMDARKAAFPAIINREARATLRALKAIFRYAFVATTVLCHWLGIWFVIWALGYDPNAYREIYNTMFAALFLVAFIFYLFAAWRPCRAFRSRLDALLGDEGAKSALSEQIRQAEADRHALAATHPTDPAIAELDAYIAEKKAEPIQSPVLNRMVLDGMLIWILLLLALAFTSTFLSPPEPTRADSAVPSVSAGRMT